MKLNFAVFKKGKTLYWVLGAVVLFVVFYFLFNKGGSSGGSVNVSSSGPSDASVASSTALAMAQLQYGAQSAISQSNNNAAVAVATLQANNSLAQTQAQADVGKYVAGLDATTQASYINAQQNIANINATANTSQASIAAATVIHQSDTQAAMFTAQLTTNAEMFKEQVRGVILQSVAAQIPAVGKNDRDNIAALVAAQASGGSISYSDRTSGSFSYNAPPSNSAPVFH